MKYVNSKRKTCDHIGDLITDDKEGNISKACTNSQKAEVLGNFFASVFVRETHYDPPNSQPRPCQTSFSDPIFSEQVIFDKLKNLNVTKSPGPDSIHPRILYELRHELVPPLKILYDTSYKLNQLPAEWKYAHITAIFKKGSKSDPSNYRPISLTSVICKLMESLVRDHIIEFFSQNSVKISSVSSKADQLHYSYCVVWMIGPKIWT